MRTLRDIMFNEIEIAIFINVRSLSKEATTLTIFTEITEIIEKIPDISDADIANANDINTILENIENTLSENIIVEPAPVRRSIRHRKATFKTVEINIMAANTMEIAEAPIISADEGESEKEDYSSKTIIAKTIIANENKPTYEKTIADSKKS
jgi:hypothetical protein